MCRYHRRMAGYSGTPLARKLGIKPGSRVVLVQSPVGFEATLDGLPDDATVARSLRSRRPWDVMVFFPRSASDLDRRIDNLAARLTPAGGLWIAWPKRASGVATDLGDGVVRARGLVAGLVDNKVCALSEVYSALRFVVRVKDRVR